MNHKYTTLLTGGAVATALLFAQIAPAFAQDTRTVTLNAGTVIPVKLLDPLSSTDSRKGDRFLATIKSFDAARALDLPRGTQIEGVVSGVRPMHDKDPGVISLSFRKIVLPNEATFPIQGSLIGLDDKSVRHDSEGRLVAKDDHRNKTMTYAGYGAGAGLLLSVVTRGNTFLDTLLGGGIGALLGNQDKSRGEPKDVSLKPGTEMGVRLDRSVDVTTYNEGPDSGYSYQEPGDRPRTDRNDLRTQDPRINDRDRDAYDDQTPAHPPITRDSYQVLKQFTDIRDNGQPIRVLVDGSRVPFLPSARPFISNGVVMVPAVPVLRAVHGTYSYTSGQFTADGAGEGLSVNIDSRIAHGSNTHRFVLPATVQRRNGTTYVPIQFLAIVTGQKLSFDRDSQTMELGGDQDSSSH